MGSRAKLEGPPGLTCGHQSAARVRVSRLPRVIHEIHSSVAVTERRGSGVGVSVCMSVSVFDSDHEWACEGECTGV